MATACGLWRLVVLRHSVSAGHIRLSFRILRNYWETLVRIVSDSHKPRYVAHLLELLLLGAKKVRTLMPLEVFHAEWLLVFWVLKINLLARALRVKELALNVKLVDDVLHVTCVSLPRKYLVVDVR